MMGWYLNAALTQLQRETNLEHPGRDKRSEGTVGDLAHAQRTSQHNPDPDGSVDALDSDVTNLDLARFKAIVLGDKRTRLMITNRVIWSKRGGGGVLRPYTYTGSSPHIEHAHTEVEDGSERDARAWGYYRGGVPPVVVVPVQGSTAGGGMTRLPVLRRSSQWRAAAAIAQRGLAKLGLYTGKVDGIYGRQSSAAALAFQRRNGLSADGVIGAQTWCALAQALLARLGLYTKKVDGKFGTGTRAGTLALQKARGLKADAIFGPKTWTAALA